MSLEGIDDGEGECFITMFFSITETLEKRLTVYLRSKKRKIDDRRGKHDKYYRQKRKEIISREASHQATPCHGCGYTDCFLDDGTCTNCGLCSDQLQFGDAIDFRSAGMATCSVYSPCSYSREKFNNFRCNGPEIQRENIIDITLSVWSALYEEGGFNSNKITRKVIYKSINNLYKNEKKNLVLRERWLYIKLFMCSNFDIFLIKDKTGFNNWYYKFRPTEYLVNRLVLQISMLEKYFDARPYGIKNRPSRDVLAIYLLEAYHPVLLILYGWYWKIPNTYKNKNNYNLLNDIFKKAKKEFAFCKWPSIPLKTIDQLQSINESILDSYDTETADLFPSFFLENYMDIQISKDSILYDNNPELFKSEHGS